MHEGKTFDIAVSESVAIFGFGQGTEVTTLSQSLQTRLTNAETELSEPLLSGSAQIASDISGSLGSNASLIRSLTANAITGSLSNTTIAALGAGIVSSSTQVSASAAAAGFGSGGGGGGTGGIFVTGSGILAGHFTNANQGSRHTLADIIVTGSIVIEASGSRTGSTIFDVIGNSGTLFQLNDISTGSLFAVNKASGVPILESFSDGKTEIGPFNNKVIIDGNVSGSSISTASFGALLVDGNSVRATSAADIAAPAKGTPLPRVFANTRIMK